VKDPVVHLALFVAITAAIVVLSGIYSEQDDSALARQLPRRFLMFAGGVALLTIAMVVAEATLASSN
jgi:hypothetical protein